MMKQETVEQEMNGEQDRLKVVISAYTIAPGLSSEPGVGWHNVFQASRFHEVWVATSIGNREVVEAELAINPMPNVHWLWIEVPKWASWYLTGEQGGRIHYYLYQLAAYEMVKKVHETVDFDIIQHVTYVSYWTPIFLSKLSSAFVWGPVGGAESAPSSFYSTLNFRSVVYERIRDTVRWIAHNLDPNVRATAENSAAAFATTEETAEKMRDLGAKSIQILPETGLPSEDTERLMNLPPREDDGMFRLISMGRFLGWKGYHLGLQAFARFHKIHPDSEYLLLGRGPQMEALQTMAKELGIADAVRFTGFVNQDEVSACLSESDVLLHPSLHDSGGWTCLEGMASGKPILCLNLGGPATQVTTETGILVDATSPEQAIQGLADSMLTLAQDADLRKRMGAKGRERIIEHFDWNKRGEYLAGVYQELVRQKQ